MMHRDSMTNRSIFFAGITQRHYITLQDQPKSLNRMQIRSIFLAEYVSYL